jgi:hypothetical protein
MAKNIAIPATLDFKRRLELIQGRFTCYQKKGASYESMKKKSKWATSFSQM